MAEIIGKNILTYNGIPLSINKIPLLYNTYAPGEAPILEFMTNDVGEGTFDPSIVVTSGLLKWDLGDTSNNIDGNTIYHIYTASGNKTVKVYKGTTSGSLGIEGLYMQGDDIVGILDLSTLTALNSLICDTNPDLTSIKNSVSSAYWDNYIVHTCNLTGTLDISGLTNLGGTFNVNGNANLQHILNPVSSWFFNTYYAGYCDLTGTLDLTGLTGLGGTFDVWGNPNLTEIKNPSSSQYISSYSVQQCGLTGILDVSGFSDLGGYLDFLSCPNLTGIIFPASSPRSITYFAASDCSLKGTIDVSGFTGISGDFSIYGNHELTQILIPTVDGEFNAFQANDCSLKITTVDDIFSKLNTWYTSNAPTQSALFWFQGGGNSWPTGSWSNADLVNIQDIFFDNSAGGTITVDISINVEPAPPELPLLVFYTEASTNAFDPQFTVT